MSAIISELVRSREDSARAEVVRRRDLSYAADVSAALDSAEFAQLHCPTVLACPDARATLRHAASLVRIPGMVLEFGVASGSSLRCIVEHLAGREIYGFDVFSGLPEDWRTGYAAGEFAQVPPDVPGAELIVGLFEDSLPMFLVAHPEPVAFLHVDADLYSSTVTIFERVGSRLVEGSIVIFDEYFNYPGWQQHEHKAWTEYVKRSGIEFSYEAYTVNHEQLVLRITKPPRHSVAEL